jgi:hypothetical protein
MEKASSGNRMKSGHDAVRSPQAKEETSDRVGEVGLPKAAPQGRAARERPSSNRPLGKDLVMHPVSIASRSEAEESSSTPAPNPDPPKGDQAGFLAERSH